MADSPIKRIVKSVKPAPVVPRSVHEHGSMTEPSWFRRFLRSLAPPPPIRISKLPDPEVRRRKRLILVTIMVLAAGGIGWEIYAYIDAAPSRAQAVYDEGMRMAATGDFRGAEDRFTRSADISPQFGPAYLQRGLARRNLGNIEGAVEDFEHAVLLDPATVQAHTELGVIYRQRGDTKRAVEEFTRSLQIAPTGDAFYQRGQLYEAQGQHDKALADYAEAIRAQPDSPLIYRARALVLDETGDHQAAEQDRASATSIERR